MPTIDASSAVPFGDRFWRRVRRWLDAIAYRQALRRNHERLIRLNDHGLNDIGLTRMDIERVWSRPSDRRDQ